jgi:excisionase family DNA binding protein
MTEALAVSVREAGRTLSIGRDTTYQLIREGRLKAVRIGRRLLIPRSELEAFLQREMTR